MPRRISLARACAHLAVLSLGTLIAACGGNPDTTLTGPATHVGEVTLVRAFDPIPQRTPVPLDVLQSPPISKAACIDKGRSIDGALLAAASTNANICGIEAIDRFVAVTPPINVRGYAQADGLIGENDKVEISINRAFIKAFKELAIFGPKKGEIALIISFDTGAVLTDGQTTKDSLLVFSSVGQTEASHLDFEHWPVIGPLTVPRGDLMVRVVMLEIDQTENEERKRAVSALFGLIGAAEPQAAPILAIAQPIANALIAMNKDDVIFDHRLSLRVPVEGKPVWRPVLATGRYAMILQEDRLRGFSQAKKADRTVYPVQVSDLRLDRFSSRLYKPYSYNCVEDGKVEKTLKELATKEEDEKIKKRINEDIDSIDPLISAFVGCPKTIKSPIAASEAAAENASDAASAAVAAAAAAKSAVEASAKFKAAISNSDATLTKAADNSVAAANQLAAKLSDAKTSMDKGKTSTESASKELATLERMKKNADDAAAKVPKTTGPEKTAAEAAAGVAKAEVITQKQSLATAVEKARAETIDADTKAKAALVAARDAMKAAQEAQASLKTVEASITPTDAMIKAANGAAAAALDAVKSAEAAEKSPSLESVQAAELAAKTAEIRANAVVAAIKAQAAVKPEAFAKAAVTSAAAAGAAGKALNEAREKVADAIAKKTDAESKAGAAKSKPDDAAAKTAAADAAKASTVSETASKRSLAAVIAEAKKAEKAAKDVLGKAEPSTTAIRAADAVSKAGIALSKTTEAANMAAATVALTKAAQAAQRQRDYEIGPISRRGYVPVNRLVSAKSNKAIRELARDATKNIHLPDAPINDPIPMAMRTTRLGFKEGLGSVGVFGNAFLTLDQALFKVHEDLRRVTPPTAEDVRNIDQLCDESVRPNLKATCEAFKKSRSLHFDFEVLLYPEAMTVMAPYVQHTHIVFTVEKAREDFPADAPRADQLFKTYKQFLDAQANSNDGIAAIARESGNLIAVLNQQSAIKAAQRRGEAIAADTTLGDDAKKSKIACAFKDALATLKSTDPAKPAGGNQFAETMVKGLVADYAKLTKTEVKASADIESACPS